jgi:hypothetical protein
LSFSFPDHSVAALDPELRFVSSKTDTKESDRRGKTTATAPDWFRTLKSLRPGLPSKIYAVAYKFADCKLEEAVEWLFEKAQTYLVFFLSLLFL